MSRIGLRLGSGSEMIGSFGLCFLPFLTLTLVPPIDGVAGISMFLITLMETLDRVDYHVWLHFCGQPPYAERAKKSSEFSACFSAFADDRNQTRKACVVSKCAIQYSIVNSSRFT